MPRMILVNCLVDTIAVVLLHLDLCLHGILSSMETCEQVFDKRWLREIGAKSSWLWRAERILGEAPPRWRTKLVT